MSVTSDVFPIVVQRAVKLSRLVHQASVLRNRTLTIRCRVNVGTNLTFMWSFGDGTTRPGLSTTHHVFHRLGEFIVKVTASNLISSASLSSHVFVVDRPCQPPPVKNMGPLKRQVIGSVVYSNYTVSFQVKPSPPVAFIQGGTNVFIGKKSSNMVTLDGQKSYDPDFPENLLSSCFDQEIPTSSPVLKFPTSLLKPKFDQFQFTLTVRSGEHMPRSDPSHTPVLDQDTRLLSDHMSFSGVSSEFPTESSAAWKDAFPLMEWDHVAGQPGYCTREETSSTTSASPPVTPVMTIKMSMADNIFILNELLQITNQESSTTQYILHRNQVNYHNFSISQQLLQQAIQVTVVLTPPSSKPFPIMLLFR
ncbi:hypothetical protein GOODEAATRI_025234 [Goodea atripinnis]|uniref:PKD domain-containing protein n=1 Tax=Goodea atripinnis TaxID=208336 RepID=A0ABV0PH66_9TELE